MELKIIRIDALHPYALPASVCALGYFDGFHKGHRTLLKTTLEQAEKAGLESALLTFDPDPWTVFNPQGDMHHLTTLADREIMAEKAGLDMMIIVHFDRQFASFSIAQFHDLLAQLGVREIVCGFDFTYAFKGQGNVETLKEDPRFQLFVASPVLDHDAKISSTRIEGLIAKGDVLEAGVLLGVPYSIAGVIVHGFARGSKLLSTPTANLQPDEEYLLPKAGVYAGLVSTEGKLVPAMINIGHNPTFGNDALSIEANILQDGSYDLYGKPVRFFFVDRLRGEKKFGSLAELEAQLKQDREQSIEILGKNRALLGAASALWSLSGDFAILEKKRDR